MRRCGGYDFFLAGGFASACISCDINSRLSPAFSDIDLYLTDASYLDDAINDVRAFVASNEKLLPTPFYVPENHEVDRYTKGHLYRPYNVFFDTRWAFTVKISPFSARMSRPWWSCNSREWNMKLCASNKKWPTGIPIQIVKYQIGEPEEVISKFDFTCCSVAIDHSNVYCSDLALDDIKNCNLRYNHRIGEFSPTSKVSFIKRVRKYVNRVGGGFARTYKIVDEDIINDFLSDDIALENDPNDDRTNYTLGMLSDYEIRSARDILAGVEDDIAVVLYMNNMSDVSFRKAQAIRAVLNGRFG
jgi:hypothetical protein